MNAIEKAEYEKLEKLVEHWRHKFTDLLIGGVYAMRTALHRRKRADDLRRAYVLAAEEVFRALDMLSEGDVREWTPEQRLAFTRLAGARQELGIIRKEHTAEQCEGKCKYHRGEI